MGRFLVLLRFKLQRPEEHAFVRVVRELNTGHSGNEVTESAKTAQSQYRLKKKEVALQGMLTVFLTLNNQTPTMKEVVTVQGMYATHHIA